MSKPYDKAAIIGRFQIPHRGHVHLYNEAKKLADEVVILIGSVDKPPTPLNPFSFDTRKTMLANVLGEYDDILPLRDQIYNPHNWTADVANKVRSTHPRGWGDYPPKVVLVGYHKDDSSYYLDLFPQWDYHEITPIEILSAIDIRTALFEHKDPHQIEAIFPHTAEFLSDWMLSSQFKYLVDEHEHIVKEHKKWEDAPYPPIFQTADALVVQSGHVLLVKRRSAPGKGLWAIPGGYVNVKETIRQAVLRELHEETKIKVQPIIVERSITREKTFDDPKRSPRGRIITKVSLIQLSGHNLPRVKGSDDAIKAKWFPIKEVMGMSHIMFEDHYDIFLNMTGGL